MTTDQTPSTPPNGDKKISNLTGWGTRRRRLTDDEVRAIRETYKYRRDLALTGSNPDDWETVTDTLKGVARDHNVSQGVVNRAVLGLSYTDAPGPIDVVRRAHYDDNNALRRQLGGVDGRSLPRTLGDAPRQAACVTITVHDPETDKTRTFRYPAGTKVTVTTTLGDDTEPLEPRTSKRK